MKIKKCIFIASRCYKAGRKMREGHPEGIVVHSTGANNPNLKRYVQPATGQENYDAIIEDLGKNTNGNDLNRYGPEVCPHAFIGKNKNGDVEIYQTLPEDICCWGCGGGWNGSYNYAPAKLQFEICEDGLNDEAYFNKAFDLAAEYCAYICKKYGLNIKAITSHKESYALGYASNHGDPENWLVKFGKTMDWFRNKVESLMKKDDDENENNGNNGNSGNSSSSENVIYRVQAGAFTVYQNAENLKAVLKKAGFNGFITKVGGLYKVQVGAYKNLNNAKEQQKKLKNSGFEAIIVKAGTDTAPAIKVGDLVKISKDATIYGTNRKFASFVYSSNLYVRQIDGSRVVISTQKTGDVTGATDIKYIIK